VVDLGIPDEVDMQAPPQVVPFLLACVPQSDAFSVERLKYCVLDPLFFDVTLGQVPVAVRDLISNLHSHRPLGQRAHQRLQHLFGSIARFVRVKEGIQSTGFIAGDEAAVCADNAPIQIVSKRQ
jgi:hypothetical protein